MIAMQYKIVLPADYSMELIENRIETKGHLLNGYPGLIYKAYLYSRKDAKHYHNQLNTYSPFYIWEDHHSMVRFLQSDGFKALCEQFGQPKVEIWFVEGEVPKPTVEHKLAWIQDSINKDSDITAINYSTWQSINVTWCKRKEEVTASNGTVYAVKYVTS